MLNTLAATLEQELLGQPSTEIENQNLETLDTYDLKEIENTAFRILYLDYLFLIYAREHREILEDETQTQKVREKLVRLRQWLKSI